jgi:membrane peptidoglycan carboxypeptidase
VTATLDRRGAPGGAGVGRPGRGRRRWWARWLRRLVVLLVALIVLVAGTTALLILRAPSVDGAPARVAAILAAHHAPGDDGVVPQRVGLALLATEDSRYYSDAALDPKGVARAVIGVVTHNGNDGGATIEQQLAKMLYAPGTSLGAELKQVGVAFRFDQHFSKRQILAMYLDAAYFGDGAYGITEASLHYFGLPASQLSWGQASLLAGLVQAPTAYDPVGHLSDALLRRRHVLGRLVATGVLTSAQAAAAAAAPLDPVVPFSG